MKLVSLAAVMAILALAWCAISYGGDATNTTQASEKSLSKRGNAGASAPADWPWWRGPNRDGVSGEKGWSSTWPEGGPKQLWKVSVGLGYSTVSVSNGRVCTMGNVKNTDAVYCLDADTGSVIWKYTYSCRQGSWQGTRIAPTVDGNMVCTLSREGHLFCFDATSGEIIWSKDL